MRLLSSARTKKVHGLRALPLVSGQRIERSSRRTGTNGIRTPGGGEGEAVEDDLSTGAGVPEPDVSSCSATDYLMPKLPSAMPHVRLCSWLQRLMRRRRISVQRSLLPASIRLMSLSSLIDVASLRLNQTTRSARSAPRHTSHTASSGLLIYYRSLFAQLERPFNASKAVIGTHWPRML